MNKLVEQIDKVINKKGSLKAPAYYIRGLFIDIVNYFEKKVDDLKRKVEQINTVVTNVNKIVKNNPKGVVYAGYSNGSIDIKDIYRTHYILSNSSEYSSWVVIYSIKQIKQIRVHHQNTDIVNATEYRQYNNLFIYSFNLSQVFSDAHHAWKVRHSITVQYNDDIEERISTLNPSTFEEIEGGVVLASSDDNKTIQIYSGNYIEINIDVPKNTTFISGGGGTSNSDGQVIMLLNNRDFVGEYTKETDNDKITIKIIKP